MNKNMDLLSKCNNYVVPNVGTLLLLIIFGIEWYFSDLCFQFITMVKKEKSQNINISYWAFNPISYLENNNLEKINLWRPIEQYLLEHRKKINKHMKVEKRQMLKKTNVLHSLCMCHINVVCVRQWQRRRWKENEIEIVS